MMPNSKGLTCILAGEENNWIDVVHTAKTCSYFGNRDSSLAHMHSWCCRLGLPCPPAASNVSEDRDLIHPWIQLFALDTVHLKGVQYCSEKNINNSFR
jgi:hypothetical protein